MWPFTKREERASSYSDAVIALLMQSASGDVIDWRAVGAAQAAASLVGRALATARLDGATEARTGLSAGILHDIGCALTLHGEAVFVIDVDRSGVVHLTRASDHDVIGGPDPADWRYRCTLSGPTYSTEKNVPADAIFHPRVNVDPARPHAGRSPIGMAGQTARLAGALERQLADEAAAPSGFVLPAPMDSIQPESLTALKSDLRKLKGRTSLVPSMAANWGDGRSGAPADWRPNRLGADPPDTLRTLRSDAARDLLAAAGVPPALLADGGRAEGRREALRMFLHSCLQPLARVIQTEARHKLMADIVLDFSELHASDVQGRARSLKSLVDAGMELEAARRITGMTEG